MTINKTKLPRHSWFRLCLCLRLDHYFVANGTTTPQWVAFLSRAAVEISCQSSACRIIQIVIIWSVMIRLRYCRVQLNIWWNVSWYGGKWSFLYWSSYWCSSSFQGPSTANNSKRYYWCGVSDSSLDSVAVPPLNLLQEPCYHSNLMPSLPFLCFIPKIVSYVTWWSYPSTSGYVLADGWPGNINLQYQCNLK